jgi:hypothetical protein
LPVEFRGGRLPPHPEATHPRLKLAPYVTAAPAPPPAVDWSTEVTEWPIYLNDQIGDCVFAEQGHHEQVLTLYGQGTEVVLPDDAVLRVYEEVGGYVPGDPSTDNGAVIQDAMSFWRKVGIAGHRIDAFAQVSVGDLREVRTALAACGPLSIGINLPSSAMDQFNNGRPWDVVADDGGVLGGHCVIVVAYDPDGFDVITWGGRARMTLPFWRRYVEEAWAVLSHEWVSTATGLDPEGVDRAGLGEAFSLLTGEPNPFRPEPAPFPPPGPAPGPVADPDQALAVAAQAWLAHRHTGINHALAGDLKTWLAAKGF